MNNIKLLILLLLLSQFAYSQNDSISNVVKTQTNLQNFECLQDSINISGRFFDKKTNEIITDGIVIIRSKNIGKKINSNGYFYLTLPKNLELEFPLLISFQSAGYKKEELYINSLNDLINLQHQIKVFLEYDDYEVGLILKAKTSIWFKIKKWFRKKNKNSTQQQLQEIARLGFCQNSFCSIKVLSIFVIVSE